MLKIKLLTTAILLSTPAWAALSINLNFAAGMSADSQTGFQSAANYWESQLTDSVTVNIDVDFTTLSSGVLGQASSTKQVISVSDYFTALTSDASSSLDTQSISNLPTLTSGALSFRTQVNTEGGDSTVSLDNDSSNNNTFLAINTSNIKAIGLTSSVSSDASITFSDSFTWDFDQSDGISSGAQDFVGVAIHEIGHALGFTSGVDTVDSSIDSNQDLEAFAVFSGLDMFRYSSADGILDLSVNTASYFSIDGGTTNLGLFSTGSSNGDGQQASHWKDNLGLGILDPTAAPAGNLNVVTQLDLDALDIIGWDLVAIPEPYTLTLTFIGIGTFLMRRTRHSVVK